MNQTQTCGWCAEEIPAGVERCPECQGVLADAPKKAASAKPARKVPPGWYDHDDNPGQKRFWDGAKWTAHSYRPRYKPRPLRWDHRPSGLIWGSLLLAFTLGILGGIIYWWFSETAGLIVLIASAYLCNALFVIGLIAKGVELGIRAARHRPDLDF